MKSKPHHSANGHDSSMGLPRDQAAASLHERGRIAEINWCAHGHTLLNELY